MIGVKIGQLLKQGDKLNGYREQLKKSNLLINWTNIAKKWIELF
jgi:hypothetical protein